MTLIAKFDCADGIVMLADSQETAGDYRVEVKKISPQTAGKYEIAVGGSGNVAPLVDGLADVMRDTLSSLPSGKSEDELKRELGKAILAYHRNEVKAYPARKPEKLMKFILCVRDTEARRFFSWRITATAINRARNYELFGWDEDLYHELVKPYFAAGASPLPIQQAIILGLRLFMVAEKSSLYIEAPTTVLVLTQDQIYEEDVLETSAMRERVETYDRLLRDLVVSCPDTSIPADELREKLEEFRDAVLSLHNAFIAAAGTRAFWTGKFFLKDYPYLRWPLGTAFSLDASGRTFTAKQMTAQEREQTRKMLKEAEHVSEELKRAASRKSEPEQKP